MDDWKSLPHDSHTKLLLMTLGAYSDDYDDAATIIDEAFEKYKTLNSDDVYKSLTSTDWFCIRCFLLDQINPGDLSLFGLLIDSIFKEVESNNLSLESLGIEPKPAGRPTTINEYRLREIIGFVKWELKTAKTKIEAYEAVARKMNKSPDTVRRYYERWLKSKTGKTK